MGVKVLVIILSVLLAVSMISRRVLALDYPDRTIELICAFAAGSNADNMARVVAHHASKALGKEMIVVNKPGGGGVRGFAAGAAAKPDGYTLTLTSNSLLSHPYLVKGVTYHYKKNFIHIAQTDVSCSGIAVKKGSPYDVSTKEFIATAQKKPSTIKVGIGGTWTIQDFVRALFEDEAGIKLIRIPYPGAAEAVPALLGGHIDCLSGQVSEWGPLYEAGKARVLGITAPKRLQKYPEIPTFQEQGLNVSLTVHHWVSAPAGTPEPIIKILAEALKRAILEPGYKRAMENMGVEAIYEGPEESLKTMERIEANYLQIIKKLDLKPQ